MNNMEKPADGKLSRLLTESADKTAERAVEEVDKAIEYFKGLVNRVEEEGPVELTSEEYERVIRATKNEKQKELKENTILFQTFGGNIVIEKNPDGKYTARKWEKDET